MTETTAHESDPSEELSLVRVAVDNSDDRLDAVVEAAERAARLGVPLQISVDHLPAGAHADPRRTHLLQRLDLAVALARSAAPGLEVRLPVDSPLEDVPRPDRADPIPHQRGEAAPPPSRSSGVARQV